MPQINDLDSYNKAMDLESGVDSFEELATDFESSDGKTRWENSL